jgi:hypothetical protein
MRRSWSESDPPKFLFLPSSTRKSLIFFKLNAVNGVDLNFGTTHWERISKIQLPRIVIFTQKKQIFNDLFQNCLVAFKTVRVTAS